MSKLRSAGTLLSAHLLTLAILHAQSPDVIDGRWSGSIETPGTALSVVVTFEATGGAARGTIDIPMQGAKGLALTNISIEADAVSFAIGGVPGAPTFRGRVEGNRINGTFSQAGATFPFALARDTSAPARTDAATQSVSEGAKLDTIRTFLTAAIKRWDVPGVAVAIVRDGKVILAEGFGLRDVEGRRPVTASTVMPIGSTTKSFTSFIIGTLVAEGKLEWDHPVIEYLPEFRVADETTTRALTVRDLLTHVSGLPRHDVVWYGSTLSRRELFDRMRYLTSSAPLRTKWQYQNLMYMAAGVLAERVSGRSWEALVEERILTPLAMTSSTTSLAELRASMDRAIGYEMKGGDLSVVDYRSAEAMGPAGAINSSASDMAKWVQLQIDGGTNDGRELIAPGVLEEIHSPQVVMPSGPSPAGDRMLFNLYAMGWMQHAYRGRRLLEHGGNIDGFSALAGFLPNERIGVVLLCNRGGSGLPTAAMRTIFDILLEERDYDWEAPGLAAAKGLDSLLKASRQLADDGIRVPNTRPSHRLAEFVGEYEHPAYGVVTVREERDRLTAELHGLDANLEHYHYDVFRLTEGSEAIEGMKIEFRTAPTGEIATLVAPLEPEVAPIEFKRRASATLSDPSLLDLYVGEYSLAGQTVSITRRDSMLIASIAGQPDYQLVPTSTATFELKDMPGYSVRFAPRTGRADRAIFVQPNGTFAARRE